MMVLKAREVRILCQPPASRPDGPNPPFTNIEAFIIIDLSMLSYITYITVGIGLVVSCINIPGVGSLGSDCFCTNNSNAYLVSGKIPLCMLSVNNSRALLIFLLLIRFLNLNETLAIAIPSL